MRRSDHPEPTTVDEYNEAVPEHAQERLRELREPLKEVAPEATECRMLENPVFMEKGLLRHSPDRYFRSGQVVP